RLALADPEHARIEHVVALHLPVRRAHEVEARAPFGAGNVGRRCGQREENAEQRQQAGHVTVISPVSVWLKPLSPSQVKVSGTLSVATVVKEVSRLATTACQRSARNTYMSLWRQGKRRMMSRGTTLPVASGR